MEIRSVGVEMSGVELFNPHKKFRKPFVGTASI